MKTIQIINKYSFYAIAFFAYTELKNLRHGYLRVQINWCWIMSFYDNN